MVATGTVKWPVQVKVIDDCWFIHVQVPVPWRTISLFPIVSSPILVTSIIVSPIPVPVSVAVPFAVSLTSASSLPIVVIVSWWAIVTFHRM